MTFTMSKAVVKEIVMWAKNEFTEKQRMEILSFIDNISLLLVYY